MTISRRDLLQLGLYTTAGLIAQKQPLLGQAMQMPAPPPPQPGMVASLPARKKPTLPSYVDRLPIPPVIRPSQDGSAIQIRMREFLHKAHRDLRPTRMWGYNSMWPGPTLEVRKGQPLSVEWINQLPTKHFLPIDTTIHGSEEGVPEVRTVTHVHGALVLPDSDGYPDAWVTSDGKTGSVIPRIHASIPTTRKRACFGITTTPWEVRGLIFMRDWRACTSFAMTKKTR